MWKDDGYTGITNAQHISIKASPTLEDPFILMKET